MMDKAIEKLTREMMEANDPLVTYVGGALNGIYAPTIKSCGEASTGREDAKRGQH